MARRVNVPRSHRWPHVTSASVLGDEWARLGFIGAWLLPQRTFARLARAHRTLPRKEVRRCAWSGSIPTRRRWRRAPSTTSAACSARRPLPNDPAGFSALLAWLRELGEIERIGLEGSAGYGAGAARYLLAAGMPRSRSRRSCQPPGAAADAAGRQERSRRCPRDRPGDPAARPSCHRSGCPTRSRELQLLVEAREDLVAEATRIRNRLHADLVVLVPGYERGRRQPRRRQVPRGRRPAAAATAGRPGGARPRPARPARVACSGEVRVARAPDRGPRGRSPAARAVGCRRHS